VLLYEKSCAAVIFACLCKLNSRATVIFACCCNTPPPKNSVATVIFACCRKSILTRTALLVRRIRWYTGLMDAAPRLAELVRRCGAASSETEREALAIEAVHLIGDVVVMGEARTVTRLEKLARLAVSTTFHGERANAAVQAMTLAKLCSFKERVKVAEPPVKPYTPKRRPAPRRRRPAPPEGWASWTTWRGAWVGAAPPPKYSKTVAPVVAERSWSNGSYQTVQSHGSHGCGTRSFVSPIIFASAQPFSPPQPLVRAPHASAFAYPVTAPAQPFAPQPFSTPRSSSATVQVPRPPTVLREWICGRFARG
jgi:hypothetical protein